ncbi:MAG: glycerol-3-phosphate dehydrogenase C-terminal domain-containing protein [Gammaproteobacteria bacterium]
MNYLLESLRRFMPQARLGREQVRFVYSGFRPLLSRGEAQASDASREDHIETAPSGLISVVGGKLTTARLMAIRVLERLLEQIGGQAARRPCRTRELSIGGTNEAVAEGQAYWVRQCPKLTSYIRILYQRYGLDAHDICAEATRIFEGRHPDPRADPIRAEVQYVCRHEMVCTVEDLIERRAGFLAWSRETRLQQLRRGAHVIREELGLSEAEFEEQFAAYQQYLDRFHSLPA